MKTKLLLSAALTLLTCYSHATSVNTAIAFGAKGTASTLVPGKGICGAYSADAPHPGTVKVTFESAPESDTIVLTFSLGELAVNELQQVNYFTNPAHTYSFDMTYPLTDPVFASLGLMPNAKILPTSYSVFKINGDQVKLTIKYAHNAQTTAAINFGTRAAASGAFAGRGIMKATVAKNATADAVLVNLQANPDNDTLVLSFALNELIHKQIRQVAYFADTLKTYAFETIYSLNDGLYAGLNLQPNAKILPTSPTQVKIIGDTVKLYVKYAHNASLLAAVTFGTKTTTGLPGKGVANVLPNDGNSAAEAVKVNFQVNPDNDTLTMVFSLYEMMNRQLPQVSYFTNPSHTYSFDDEFPLSGTVYAPLNLPPNAKISRKSPTALSITGDQVKLTIAYAHD